LTTFGSFGDVHVELGDDHVACAEIRRPPHNYFDIGLLASLAGAFEALDADPACRAIVLCSLGKSFCAGAQLGGRGDPGAPDGSRHLYDEAVRLFSTRTPVVAAVQMGLCDRLVPLAGLRDEAHALAREIALSAPLAVASIRETLRGDLPERIRKATDREKAEQERLQKTGDFREGVRAMAERRTPDFTGG
jgi:enoyl-CoA hydratase/carnithine racemase